MKYITLFKNFTTVLGRRTLAEVVDGIRSDHYKESILKIRELVDLGDQEKVDRLKKGLVAFTVSGMFVGGRKMSFLETYNPFVILDIDKLDLADLPDLILKTKEIEFTRVAFLSPSGRGLKIIVEVDSEMERHGLAYRRVSDFYENELGVEIDKSGKDITRLCFMSYDPDIYFNEESTVFTILEDDKNNTQTSSPASDLIPRRAPDLSIETANLTGNYQQAFGVCVMQTNAKSVFKKGNRNNYIYQLGVICSHAGIPLEVAIVESKKEFDFNNKEIERTIKSAYSWQPYIPVDTSSKTNRELPAEAPPIIPKKVFEQLPLILKRGCEAIKSERERDVFLTGTIGVLSGLLPKVTGVYDGSIYTPNLFVFVIAPAANGKGSLKFAKELGLAYHKELLDKSKKAQRDFKKAFSDYKRKSAKFERGNLEELPEEPEEKKIKALFIPANSSSAMMISHLESNESSGVLFESEADSLGKVLKQDWGGYSDLLRKAFHHESISYSRKASNEFIEIEKPKLSVVLSGTPGQIKKLISSAEDGLFSRFIFYAFQMEVVWRDVSKKGRANDFHIFYEGLSKEILEMVYFFKTQPMEFDLTEDQWEELNTTFEKMMKETNQDFGVEAVSIVMRMGLICFRIAMIFSAVRKFEEQSKAVKVICKDEDFESAILLAKTYWYHSVFVYERLPASSRNAFTFVDKKKQLFYNSLPDKFKRKEAMMISKEFGICDRTADRYLKYLLKNELLEHSLTDEYGTYCKI